MTLPKGPFSHALLGILLLTCSAQGMAQSLIPGLKTRSADAPAAQAQTATEDASPEAQINALEQRLAKLQSQATPVQPVGASVAEWAQYQQMQASEARTLSAHISALRNLAETRRTEQDRAATRKAWKGFGQAPPYDIALVDDWWAQVRRKAREIESTRVEQRLLESMFDQAKQTLKAAQQTQRQADELLQTSNDPAQAARLRWQAELTTLGSRYSEARLGLFETLRILLAETMANQQAERQWLEEKASLASRTLTLQSAGTGHPVNEAGRTVGCARAKNRSGGNSEASDAERTGANAQADE